MDLVDILKLSQRMNSETDLTALLDLLAQEAARLLDADRSSIFILDQAHDQLWSKVAIGTDEVLRFNAKTGIAGATLAGTTIRIDDVHKDPRFNPELDRATGYQTRNILSVPLRHYRGEILGVFQVLNKREGSFGQDDEDLLGALAEHAAVAIDKAQQFHRLSEDHELLLRENAALRNDVQEKFTRHGLIGSSRAIQRIRETIDQVSDSPVSVLITGESGTGKEVIAKAIHYCSSRADQPFVALNCAALPESLVESELFGVERGVATGVEARAGKFEVAHQGTLFLDEVGELNLANQAKLLRVLQERVVERLGSANPTPVDVRIIAATNRDLEDRVREEQFRGDLFYRLRVVHIETCPLRQMPEDIPLLANTFLESFCQELDKPPKEFDEPALRALQRYRWPGNVRELENEIQRVVVCSRSATVSEADLAEPIRKAAVGPAPSVAAAESLKAAVEDLEKRMIQESLRHHENNQLQAAKQLGISRQGLTNKMKRYGINVN